MDLNIAGKRALVCASSKGLGRGCAEALAEAGCALVMNARSAGPLEAAAKDKEFDLPADVVAGIQDDMNALLRRENLDMQVAAPTKAKLGDF